MSGERDIKRILVAHDFSETAGQALRCALEVAQRFGATITVFHAYEVPAYGYPDALVSSLDLTADIERAAAMSLDEVKEEARRSNVDVALVLRRGIPWAEIGKAAVEMNADLIVMGTHGHGGIARALLGSVAEKVVRTADSPVLTVGARAGDGTGPTPTSAS